MGPQNWGLIDADCAGLRQSPIDIVTSSVQSAKKPIPLAIFNAEIASESVFVGNSGHGADVVLGFNSAIKIATYGGPLLNPYIFKSFHLHWPAEHTINGRRYDAELHVVSYNSIYGSFENAITHSDGLAVLGMFFELDSTILTTHKFVELFKKIHLPETSFTTTGKENMFRLNDIIGTDPLHVYSYPGSLTTPGCGEFVTWMVG